MSPVSSAKEEEKEKGFKASVPPTRSDRDDRLS